MFPYFDVKKYIRFCVTYLSCDSQNTIPQCNANTKNTRTQHNTQIEIWIKQSIHIYIIINGCCIDSFSSTRITNRISDVVVENDEEETRKKAKNP